MNKIADQTEQVVSNIENYERRWHIYKITLLIFIAVIVSLSIVKVYTIARDIKQTQMNQQEATQEARKANVLKLQQLTDYVKCLSLARFDNPELVSPNVTKDEVSAALDKCAKEQ